jgi:hypothetical protein
MRFHAVKLVIVAAALSCAAPALATVTYTFSSPTASFIYSPDTFLTQDTTVPSSELDSCSVGGLSCVAVSFNEIHDNFPASIEIFENLTTYASSYVNAPDFETPGTYETLSIQGGSFTIANAVPEPATWAMMLLGFGGIGVAIRRSKRRSRALMQMA